MSLNVVPVETLQCLDPVVNVNSRRQYVILKGGSRVTYKSINSTSYSDSTFSFTAPPPNPSIIVDRKLALRAPVRVSFTGTAPPGQNLLQTGFDAPRANCLSSVMNSLDVTLNNTSTSINTSDIIHPLSRYNTGALVRDGELSIGPQMQDQYQLYTSGTGTVRNPLGGYGDVYPEIPRGAFPYTLVTNTNTTAVIEFTPSEFLYISPFAWGKEDRAGFIGLQTMDFTFNWGDLSRIWSHATNSGSTIATITATFHAQPSLLFKYITPSVVSPLPQVSIYPYYKVQRYPTTPGSTLAPNTTTTLRTQNIQLQSIPHRMYLCARVRKADRVYTTTDTYCRIDGISLNWNNNAGLLASASIQDLFRLSKKNGLNYSYPQWVGTTDVWAGGTNSVYGTIGSVLCLVPSIDFALLPDECPGLLGTFQVQADLTITNVNQTDTITPELMLITIEEGTWTIMNNQCISVIGAVSRQDVVNSANRPMVDYEDIKDAYGGNFWSGLKRFGEKIWEGIKWIGKKIAPVAKAVAPVIAPMLPALFGLGKKGGSIVGGRKRKAKRGRKKKGGVLIGAGGRKMSRAELRRALM